VGHCKQVYKISYKQRNNSSRGNPCHNTSRHMSAEELLPAATQSTIGLELVSASAVWPGTSYHSTAGAMLTAAFIVHFHSHGASAPRQTKLHSQSSLMQRSAVRWLLDASSIDTFILAIGLKFCKILHYFKAGTQTFCI